MWPSPSSGTTALWTTVEELSRTDQRLLVTAATVAVAAALVVFLLPAVGRQTAAFVDRWMPQGRLRRIGERLSDYVPTTLGVLWIRLVQAGVVVAAGLVVLTAWGQIETARRLVAAAGITPGLLVRLVVTVGLLFGAYVASSIFAEAVHGYSRGAAEITEHQEEIVVRVGNVAILVLAVTSALTLWGQNLSGLLIGAGFLGIVVGMAARQTLGSMIAGFVLMFSRPFTIGDWVQIGDDEGIVTNITIMNTRLKNFDGETIVIPNDAVTGAAITNRSERGHLRIRLDVSVDYETDPDRAESVALEAMSDVTAITDSPPPQVVPKQFGDSAVVLELRFWIDNPTPPGRWRAISAVIESVKAAFEREGIKIPFPQRELSDRPVSRREEAFEPADPPGGVEAQPED